MQYSYIPTQIGRTLRLKVYLVDGDKKVGHSLISSTNNTWTITGWYIDEEYQNKGLGKELLHNSFTYLYNLFGTPNKIDYICRIKYGYYPKAVRWSIAEKYGKGKRHERYR